MAGNILIVGIGNETRRDDAIGLMIARRLRDLQLPDVTVIEESGEGVALMDAWKKHEAVIIVDAVASGARPGMIVKIDAHAQPIPSSFFHYSTHTFSVAEAIELARVLHELPPCLYVYGIEGACFQPGTGISRELQKSSEEVISMIENDVKSLSTSPSIWS